MPNDYRRIGGCKLGSACDDGLYCGESDKCSRCSFEECIDHARTNGAYALSYRSTGDTYCRLCNQNDFENPISSMDWGLYVKGNYYTNAIPLNI